MAIHFPPLAGSSKDERFARTSQFCVNDLAALTLALTPYRNIVVHPVYEGRGGHVRLTTNDGTWYTGFVNGEEGSIIDEILLPFLMEREVVHLYQLVVTPTGMDSARFSLCANGQCSYSTSEQSESELAEQLLAPIPV